MRMHWAYDAECDVYLQADEEILRPHIDDDYDYELLAPCKTTKREP